MRGFITGLPRSRTHWFAQYFDGIEGVTAHFEPLNGMRSKQAFYDLVETGCIISDSGLYITDFERFGLPTVIIERDIGAVYESLLRVFGRLNYSILEDQAAKLAKLSGLRVPFEDINARMEEIHNYLGVPFNAEYADRMVGLNLQVSEIAGDVESFELWAA